MKDTTRNAIQRAKAHRQIAEDETQCALNAAKDELAELYSQIEGRDAEIESLIKQNGELYAALTRLLNAAENVRILDETLTEEAADFFEAIGFAGILAQAYKKI